MQPSVNIHVSHDSAVFAKLRQRFGTKANIQPTQLRLEKVVASGDVNETFTLSAESAMTRRPTERFLSTNDVFVCTHMSVGLYKELTLTGTAQRAGNAAILYYPDKTVFNTAATAANVSEADALEAIYNGTISLKSNSYEVIDSQDVLRYRSAPITQVAAATQASSGSFHGEQRVPFHAPILFGGNKRNEITLKQAQGADTVQIGGAADVGKNVYVLLMYGYVVRNAAESLTLAEASEALLG
jgi:hypothetical protein